MSISQYIHEAALLKAQERRQKREFYRELLRYKEATMSSPRTGILSLIRFDLGQNWDAKINKSKFLAGWRASFLVLGYAPSKS